MSFFGHYKTYIFAFFADNVTILQNTVVNFRNNWQEANAHWGYNNRYIEDDDICHGTINCIQQGYKKLTNPNLWIQKYYSWYFFEAKNIHSNFTNLQNPLQFHTTSNSATDAILSPFLHESSMRILEKYFYCFNHRRSFANVRCS